MNSKLEDIYTDGDYLQSTVSWHAEDSPWKAEQIHKIVSRASLELSTVAEIGCGAGVILDCLSRYPCFEKTSFAGYDISPQAIELCQSIKNPRIQFYEEDLIAPASDAFFDLLLVVDVFEHVPDYLGFLESCQTKADYKVYHIPLDLSVSSIARDNLTKARDSVGHLHYYTASTALATLRDTGHEILDYHYTAGATELFMKHPSTKTALANVPRYIISRFSRSLAARVLGGYSLMVLAR